MIPKFITNITDNFKITEVLLWLKECFTFIFLPKKFFINFYKQPFLSQVYQTLFYIILNIGIALLVMNTSEIRYSVKFLFSFILFAVPFLISNSLSQFIINKKSFNLWKLTSFIIIVIVLCSIPLLIFSKIFLTTENYTFKLFANICSLIIFLYCMFLYWHVIFDKSLKIFLGYLLNIIFLNLSLIITSLIFRDSYSKQLTLDPIIEEFNQQVEGMNAYYGIPFSFSIEDTNEENIYKHKISFLNNDTLYYYGDAEITFMLNKSVENVKHIDSIKPLLIYKRNKETFSDLSMCFNSIHSFLIDKPCDTCLLDYQIISTKKDGTIDKFKAEFIVDSPYIQSFLNYEAKKKKIVSMSDYANSPFEVINILYKPTDWVFTIFGIEAEESSLTISL
jgi:hypothetical protein